VLSANGQNVAQPLLMKPDPRVKAGPNALQREFELAVKVQSASARAGTALGEAQKLLKTLAERAPHETRLRSAMVQLAAKVSDLAGALSPSDASRGGERPPARGDSFRSLAADLANLQRAVDGADADPGADVQASYTTLMRMLSASLNEWDGLKKKDVAALNAALIAAGDHPVGH
jgi:hypothetical protein